MTQRPAPVMAAGKSLPTLFRIFYRLGTPMFIFGIPSASCC